MRVLSAFAAVLSIPAILSDLVAATPHAAGHAVVTRAETHRRLADSTNRTLTKRDFGNVRFTYYHAYVAEVACGGWYNDGDFIVALNIEQWDGGSHCGDKITISFGGKHTTATIVDECPGCPYGALDLTPGLFTFLAGSLDAGVLQGSWNFGGAPPPPPPPPPPPKTTKPPPPPPPPTTTHHTTHTPPPPTTSETPSSTSSAYSTSHTTSSSSFSSSSSTSSSSTISSTSATSSLSITPSASSTITSSASPSATPGTEISQLYMAILRLVTLSAASAAGEEGN